MQPSKKTEEDHPRAQACHASLTPLCWVTLPFQQITFVRHPTHGALKLAKLGVPRRCCSDRARIRTVHEGQVEWGSGREITPRRSPPARARRWPRRHPVGRDAERSELKRAFCSSLSEL